MHHTIPHPRRERAHLPIELISTDRTAGIRTFYNMKIREDNKEEFSIDDKIQRKQKVNLSELRKTYYIKNGNSCFE